jgi:hypothetical protein
MIKASKANAIKLTATMNNILTKIIVLLRFLMASVSYVQNSIKAKDLNCILGDWEEKSHLYRLQYR